MSGVTAPLEILGLKKGKEKVKEALTPDLSALTAPPGEEVTAPPSVDDPQVEAARMKERKLSKLRRGRASTILSRGNRDFSRGTNQLG